MKWELLNELKRQISDLKKNVKINLKLKLISIYQISE